MKKSFILLELIISIVLLSVIFLTTTTILLKVNKVNKSNLTTNLTKLEFETTKLFLINILKKEKNLNKIKYINNNLYYNNNLLQENISTFKTNKQNHLYQIDICINLYQNICQKWIIK